MMKITPMAAAMTTLISGWLMMACGGLPSASMTAPPDTIMALERACLSDPTNAAHWARLATALEADGQRQRATRFYQQAATLSAHDARRDYALLAGAAGSGPTPVPVPVPAAAAARAAAAADPYADMPRTQVQRLGAAMVEVVRVAAPVLAVSAASAAERPALRTPAPTSASALAPAPASPSSAPAGQVRLEISNGNGVTGAAARLARVLDVAGVTTVRLTNARPFTVPHTRIEYPDAQREMAEALSQQLDIPLKVRRETSPRDLRIVLGHDSGRLK